LAYGLIERSILNVSTGEHLSGEKAWPIIDAAEKRLAAKHESNGGVVRTARDLGIVKYEVD
jgi:hypothetical protein